MMKTKRKDKAVKRAKRKQTTAAKKVEMTSCENCSRTIEIREVQQCLICHTDGLGNCCIGVDDHNCAQ